MPVLPTLSPPLELQTLLGLFRLFLSLLDLVNHRTNVLFVFADEIFLGVSVADLPVQQLVKDLVQLTRNHLVVHDMCEMGRSQHYLLKLLETTFVLFLQQTVPNIHIPLYSLEEEHLFR